MHRWEKAACWLRKDIFKRIRLNIEECNSSERRQKEMDWLVGWADSCSDSCVEHVLFCKLDAPRLLVRVLTAQGTEAKAASGTRVGPQEAAHAAEVALRASGGTAAASIGTTAAKVSQPASAHVAVTCTKQSCTRELRAQTLR